MKPHLSRIRMIGVAGLAAASLTAGPALAQSDGQPTRLSAAELRQAVAKTKDGLATSPLPTGAATVIMARRERTGEIELHMGQNDALVANAGHATVLVGKTVEGNREVSPGEWRGGTMSGAKSYAMAPGDVLWIPAGLPHQVIVPARGAFDYIAFKYHSADKKP